MSLLQIYSKIRSYRSIRYVVTIHSVYCYRTVCNWKRDFRV